MKPSFTVVVKVLTVVCAVLAFIAFILQLVGFSSSNWLVGPGEGKSPFVSIGWHSACFDQCRFPYCPGGDYVTLYDGCYKWTFNEWIWDDERMREIRSWLMPGWYNSCKIQVIVAIPIGFCALALSVINFLLGFSEKQIIGRDNKDLLLHILLYVAALCLLGAGVNITVAVTWFSMNCRRLDYMPMPEKNSLGFSFWLTAAAGALYCLAFITSLLAAVYKSIRGNIQKDPRYSEDMMMGK